MTSKLVRDVAIVGAGPAGLSAARALRFAAPSLSVSVFESGSLRDPGDPLGDPARLVRGVGGAGLWSDGKFSFFPSASRLWGLENADGELEQSYESIT